MVETVAEEEVAAMDEDSTNPDEAETEAEEGGEAEAEAEEDVEDEWDVEIDESGNGQRARV